jgi:serine/threonine protein kinase
MAAIYTVLQLTAQRYPNLPDSNGHTSTVYLLSDDTTPLVCKSIHPHYADILLPTEQEAYERFSSHDPPLSLLSYHGLHDEILEYAELGNLHDWLLQGNVPSKELLFKWAYQAAEALEFAHGLGVLHADIHCLNFFLTKTLDLKVGDWGGASIDGVKSHCSYRYSHRMFGLDGTDIPAEKGIWTATEMKIRERIVNRQFPDTEELGILGGIVTKCWNGGFDSMTDVKRAIEHGRDKDIEVIRT